MGIYFKLEYIQAVCSCPNGEKILLSSFPLITRKFNFSFFYLQLKLLPIFSSFLAVFVSFEALVEREWLQAGHPFSERCAKSAFATTKHRQEAPTFLLFLDAVWQVKM